MTKKIISAVLLIALAAPVFASDWGFTVGAHMENEMNLEDEFAGSDLYISPAVNFKVQYKDVYVKVEGENRIGSEAYLTGGESGHNLRQKVMVGGKMGFGALTFTPEYELRMTTPVDDGYDMDGTAFENRFKLRFGMNMGDHRPWLNMMPTVKTSATGNNTYYHEVELGYRYMISGNQNVALGLYNEFSTVYDSSKTNNELQARLYYSYKFDSGITLAPFARIGLYRDRAGADDNQRRDRVGAKVSYSAPNGVAPFAEAWWQGTQRDVAGLPDYNNRIMFKMGATYSW